MPVTRALEPITGMLAAFALATASAPAWASIGTKMMASKRCVIMLSNWFDWVSASYCPSNTVIAAWPLRAAGCALIAPTQSCMNSALRPYTAAPIL